MATIVGWGNDGDDNNNGGCMVVVPIVECGRLGYRGSNGVNDTRCGCIVGGGVRKMVVMMMAMV